MISTLYVPPTFQPTPTSANSELAESTKVSVAAQSIINTRNSSASISPQLPENKSFLWGTYAKNLQPTFDAKAEAPTLVRTYSNASTVSAMSSEDGSTTTCSTRTFEPLRPATPSQSARFVSAATPKPATTSQIPRFNSDSQLLSKTMVLEHSIDHPLHAQTQLEIRRAIKQQDLQSLDKIAYETPIAKAAIDTYKATLRTAQAIQDSDHSPSAKIDILAKFYNAASSEEEAAFVDTVRKAAIAQLLTLAFASNTKL